MSVAACVYNMGRNNRIRNTSMQWLDLIVKYYVDIIPENEIAAGLEMHHSMLLCTGQRSEQVIADLCEKLNEHTYSLDVGFRVLHAFNMNDFELLGKWHIQSNQMRESSTQGREVRCVTDNIVRQRNDGDMSRSDCITRLEGVLKITMLGVMKCICALRELVPVCTLNLHMVPHLRRLEWSGILRESSTLRRVVDESLEDGFYCLRSKYKMWNWSKKEFAMAMQKLRPQ